MSIKNIYGQDLYHQKNITLEDNTRYCFCDFRDASVQNKTLENVIFYGGRVNGFDLSKVQLKNVSFEFCYASLEGKILKLPQNTYDSLQVKHSHLNTSPERKDWLTWHPAVVDLAESSLKEKIDINNLLNPFPEAKLVEAKADFLCVFPLLAVLLIHPDEKVKYYTFETLWEGLRIGFQQVNYKFIAEWMASFFSQNYCFINNKAGHFLDFFSYFYEKDTPIVSEDQVLDMINQVYSHDLTQVEKGIMVNATVVLSEISRFYSHIDYQQLIKLLNTLPLPSQIVILDIIEKAWDDGVTMIGTSFISGEQLHLLFEKTLIKILTQPNPTLQLRGLLFFDNIIDLYEWKDFDLLHKLAKDTNPTIAKKAHNIILKIS